MLNSIQHPPSYSELNEEKVDPGSPAFAGAGKSGMTIFILSAIAAR